MSKPRPPWHVGGACRHSNLARCQSGDTPRTTPPNSLSLSSLTSRQRFEAQPLNIPREIRAQSRDQHSAKAPPRSAATPGLWPGGAKVPRRMVRRSPARTSGLPLGTAAESARPRRPRAHVINNWLVLCVDDIY